MVVSKLYKFVLSLTIMMLAATVCWAVGGSISGTVKDSSGGAIPGAMLTLRNTSLGTQFKTTADSQGLYSFPNLPVGRYINNSTFGQVVKAAAPRLVQLATKINF